MSPRADSMIMIRRAEDVIKDIPVEYAAHEVL
jgi:hypothetical protein